MVLMAALMAQPALAKTSLDLGVAGLGARPIGMGKAYVAVADDANAVFLNPAGLSQVTEWKATSMSSQILQIVDYKHAAAVMPTKYGTVGIGYISLSTPAGYYTTDKASLSSASEINYGSSELVLSYAKEVGKLFAGANLKFLNGSFTGGYSGSGSGYGLDLGVLGKVKEDLNVGASLQNIISAVSWGDTQESLGSLLKLGIAGNPIKDKVLVAIDADFDLSSSNNPLTLHTGIEFKPVRFLTLRAGADQYLLDANEIITDITGGVGISLKNFNFDYAYHQDKNLASNSSHYFSISISQPQVRSKALTEIKEQPEVLGFYENTSEISAVQSEVNPEVEKGILSYYK